ncbi:MAG: hypothetical protein QFB89_03570 [Pseudomonadota bacterium]|nr:hypothetical protein [Pseudomonadota bacterium]
MIDTRMLRDIGLALVLAIPTLSLTRPVAAETLSPAASQSPIVANAAIAEMTIDERRSAIPTN